MKIATASVLAIALSTAVCAQAQSASPSASSANGPVVVQRVGFENQTGAIPQTTIYTPSHTGLYRINIYMEEVSTNSANGYGGKFCGMVEYTNDSGATQATGTTCALIQQSLNNAGFGVTFVVRMIANTPMLFLTALSGGPPQQPYAYSAYVVIERL